MTESKNYLLAVAIDNYSGEWEKLKNAVNDTTAVVEVLTSKYSFELLLEPLYNEEATKENILSAFNNSINVVGREDNLIIYYGGHGFMHPLTMKGYWVPYGSRKNIADFIPNSEIKDFIESVDSKHTFLITDSCFSGTFLSRTRSSANTELYSSLHNKTSRWMLASGGEESVSDGPAGMNSPFAKYLLKFLNENKNQFCSVLEIIRYVSLLTAHHSKQHPNGAYILNIKHDHGQMILCLKDELLQTKNDKTNGEPHTEILRQEMRSVYRRKSKLSAGKEILLLDSLHDKNILLLCECFRFDAAGNKKIYFQGDKVKMPTEDDPDFTMTLHARFATWEGFTRFWEENKDLYSGQQIFSVPAVEEIDTVEQTESAILHQGIIQDMMDSNPQPMQCLHCNTMITEQYSLMVEIDEMGLIANAGNIHLNCRRNADRILGRSEMKTSKDSNLVSFDAKKWIDLRKHGQAFLSGAKKINMTDKIPVISWNSQHNFNSGNYCIKYQLENGSTYYVRVGKEIHRFSEEEIDFEVEEFNKSLVQAEEIGDPIGYTSIGKIFGSFSLLKDTLLEGEFFLKILKHEKEKYSHQLEVIDHTIENDYTPLGLIVDPDAGRSIILGNSIPLISEPILFESMHSNWNNSGYSIGPCAIKIIENDKELDLYLNSFFSDGMQVVIDPFFKSENELDTGIYIKNIEDIKQHSQVRSNSYPVANEGIWKAGDRVKVVFPNIKTEKHATGILLTDEFTDEDGDLCSIFQPIEDGRVRKDLMYKMPVTLFVKD